MPYLNKKQYFNELFGTPDATQTHDPQLRRLLLYSAELPGHNVNDVFPPLGRMTNKFTSS